MTAIIIIVAIIIVFAICTIASYNSLVKLNERVNEAWSDITVQLKRRSDLIPNLVSTVKGYTKHEISAIKDVADARAKMMGARSISDTAKADKSFTDALSRLLAVSESYPELKASENYKQLSSELSDTEDKIQAARRFYNSGAKELNTKIKTFPSNIINNAFAHYKKREYYEVEESEAKKIANAPKVEF